eukprot:TRINITY_DN52674_c0_g1_i2.p1 TRINITY_DN52674_c0_g1~~TRINITY_DN52674_c0_g1_i2.p1  ORF type:complete len:408 (-),score=51.66 TRINITY_DN52674_c0_g1_i2:108-1301(-)
MPQGAGRGGGIGFPIAALATFLLVISFAFGIACCASRTWIKVDTPNASNAAKMHSGLWDWCIDTTSTVYKGEHCVTFDNIFPSWKTCDIVQNPTTPSSQNANGRRDGIRASRAFTILGIIFACLAMILCLGITFMLRSDPVPSKLILPATVLALFTWIFFLIAWAVYMGVASKEYCGDPLVNPKSKLKCEECSWGWGWIFCLICWIVAFIAFLLLLLLCCKRRRPGAKAPQSHTSQPPAPVDQGVHSYPQQMQPFPTPTPNNTGNSMPVQPPAVRALDIPAAPEGARPTIGAEIKMLDDSFGNKDNVVVVHAVKSGGPAERADIQPNDILAKWNGVALDSKQKFIDSIANAQIDGQVYVTIVRNGTQIDKWLDIEGTTEAKHAPQKVASSTVVNYHH